MELVMPRIINKPLEWYSTHCAVCGKAIADRKGFKNDPWTCEVEFKGDRTRQVILCGKCVNIYAPFDMR
mgnify:CR=1 FL=1